MEIDHKLKHISGLHWSKVIREEIAQEVKQLVSEGKPQPKLAGIIVGDRDDSKVYVRNKEKVGIACVVHRLPGEATTEELIDLIKTLNDDPTVHGILVQLPLPSTVNERQVLEAVSPIKDVDGVAGPTQLGKLAYKGYEADYIPCTARACLELLRRENVTLCGANVVVLGRSAIVGIPVSLLMIQENATVTLCHSRTKDIGEIVKRADIVIAAIGQPQFVKGEWIKENAVVIDVGINRLDDPTKKAGFRLVGDVHFESAIKVCSKITPVPGGVGPMTIAMLLKNVVDASKKHGK